MADKPAAAEHSTAPADAVHDDELAADKPAAPTDMKSIFAAALARKKQVGQDRTASLDGRGGVGGATSNRKAAKVARQKAGGSA